MPYARFFSLSLEAATPSLLREKFMLLLELY